MDYFSTMAISAAGMTAQKARIEAATLNLANMNTSIAAGTQGYRPVTAVIHSQSRSFASRFANGAEHMGLVKAELVTQAGLATRSVYEPGHPDADAAGMVSYPAVDHAGEMMTVMTALRAYEANLTAMQATRMLAAKALEIGSPS